MKLLFSFPRILAAVFVLSALSSCTDYGKKVTFTGHKGEVFYKGEGVTEADANATGKFLEENEFFLKDDKKRSVQISKKGDRYEVRVVIDEKGMAKLEGADEKFAMLGAMMSKAVFNKAPVDIIYTDDGFKDKKTISFKPELLEAANLSDEIKEMKTKKHENNTLYYTKDISEDASDNIVNYLVKEEFFSATSGNDLILSKTANGGAHFKFPVKADFTNEAGLQKIDAFAKELKAGMFEGVPMQFEVLDENMKSVKIFNY